MIIRTVYNGEPCLLNVALATFIQPRNGRPGKTYVLIGATKEMEFDEPFESIVEKVRATGLPGGDYLLDLTGPVGGLTDVVQPESQKRKGSRK